MAYEHTNYPVENFNNGAIPPEFHYPGIGVVRPAQYVGSVVAPEWSQREEVGAEPQPESEPQLQSEPQPQPEPGLQPQSEPNSQSQPESDPEPQREETSATPEQLSDGDIDLLCAQGGAMLDFWGRARGVRESNGGIGASQWQHLYNCKVGDRHKYFKTDKAIKDQFVADGVAESLAFWKIDKPFGSVRSDSEFAGETVVMMTYETNTNGDNKRYGYRDSGGRPGNAMTMHLYLPKKMAEKIQKVLMANPQEIHRVVERLATGKGSGQFGLDPEDWTNFRPPWGEWREQDGGVSKIALRNRIDDDAEQAQILSY